MRMAEESCMTAILIIGSASIKQKELPEIMRWSSHCYSSKDLYNWKDEGVALSVVTDDSTHSIAKGCILERPKVIYNKKNNNYVMWFHLEPKGAGYSGALSGIAVSDKVAGPKFLRAVRPNAGSWPTNVQDIHKQRVPESDGVNSQAEVCRLTRTV